MKFKKAAAAFLSVVMTLQIVSAPVAAALTDSSEPVISNTQTVDADAAVQLQNGSGFLPADAAQEQVRQFLFDTLVVSKEGVDPQSLDWEYYATGWDALGLSSNPNWVSVEGGSWSVKGFLGITTTYSAGALKDQAPGQYKVRLAGTTQEVILDKADKSDSSITLNEGLTLSLPFNQDMSLDYSALYTAIFEQVFASSTPELGFDDLSITFYNSNGLTSAWTPLEGQSGLISYPAISAGTHSVRLSWGGSSQYKAASAEVQVVFADNRQDSSIVYVENAAITYSADPAAMKQALLDGAIDWNASSLPARETLSVDNFRFEYVGVASLGSVLPEDLISTKGWAPVEGGYGSDLSNMLFSYPQMGAGEAQQIRITYLGGADFRPSAVTEGTVNVKKAPMRITVKTGNIHVGDPMPADFITLNPNDPTVDVYTIYGGITSDVTTSLYVDLPHRILQDNSLIKLLDPVVETLFGKSFSQLLNDGMTLGQLRELLSSQALQDLLKLVGMDTGFIGQIITAINQLPAITDSIRVAFGTPNQDAGLYMVAAVTDSTNYRPALGAGVLLVRIHSQGTKINWNQEMGYKITVEEAKTFDFGATLSHNGDVSVEQNLHYLYTGFTSTWKPYASTSAPTEPGRYAVTVVTLGGNYVAAPISRNFQIVK